MSGTFIMRLAAVAALAGLAATGERPSPPPAATAPAGTPAAAAAPTGGAVPAGADTGWTTIVPGMDLGVFVSPRARGGDGRIRILRLDPQRFRLRLLNASAPSEGQPLTARGWAYRHRLAAVINSSMYQADLRSSVSLMRTSGHVNNPHLSKDKAVLAFDPADASLPPVQIIDRECEDFEAASRPYRTLVQSIRMVSCRGTNVWSQQPRAWSTAAIGIDRKGRVLFIHARAPHSTHDLIATLLELPIELRGAMYAEGGHEAQMFVRAGGKELEFLGSVDPSGEEDGLDLAWPIPNVVGAEPIDAARDAAPPATAPR